MSRAGFLVLAVAAAMAACELVAGCNSVLGITAAQLFLEGGSEAAGAPEAASADDAGDASAPSSYTLSCANYCEVIGQNCTSVGTPANIEYLSPDVCGQICPQFERVPVPGNVVDPNEQTPMTNTLNCRIWHANAAQGGPPEAHTHCPHAGPLGGRMCGADPCVEFCTLDLAFCTGDAAAYAGMNDCLNACEPDGGPDSGPDGGYPGYPYNINPDDMEVTDLAASGNTLNCRMYHLENFLYTGDAIHCSHTALNGGGVCIGN